MENDEYDDEEHSRPNPTPPRSGGARRSGGRRGRPANSALAGNQEPAHPGHDLSFSKTSKCGSSSRSEDDCF